MSSALLTIYLTLYTIRKMKTGKIFLILILTLILASCKGLGPETDDNKSTPEFDFSKIEKIRISKFTGPIVSDFDSLFTPTQTTELTELIFNYDLETTRQIVVVTIDSILPYTEIQKYASDLGNYWGVGEKNKNNGLTIVVCKPCRQIGIATGTGTELILTDEICNEVIDKTIIPKFRNGDFYDGIKNGIVELIKKWK